MTPSASAADGLTSEFRLRADDGVELFVRRVAPAGAPRAVVHIVHGMSEHGARYARSAQLLRGAGFAVYVPDLRGHGQTAGSPADHGYFADRGGWRRLVEDLDLVQQRIAQDLPGVPRFLLGHSMGSMLVRDYLCSHGHAGPQGRGAALPALAGAVLSGTGGGTGFLARVGGAIARLERLRLGARGRSALLQKLSFGNFNRGFAPNRTEYDWLSRDPLEVDKYAQDASCGFPLAVQAWIDVFGGIVRIEDAANLRCMRPSLPIYLLSGDRDPVGGQTRGVRWLIDAYRRAGVSDVTARFYPGARHEMFNETNRDEVHRDLIAWFDRVLTRPA